MNKAARWTLGILTPLGPATLVVYLILAVVLLCSATCAPTVGLECHRDENGVVHCKLDAGITVEPTNVKGTDGPVRDR